MEEVHSLARIHQSRSICRLCHSAHCKNLVAAGVCDQALVQISYAIGVAEPTSLFVDTYGSSKIDLTDSEIARTIKENLSLTPYEIEKG